MCWFALVKAPAMGRATGNEMFSAHAAAVHPPAPPKAAAPTGVAATVAVAPIADNKPHLPTSISSLRRWFERADLQFHSAPLSDGTPRLLGQHPDSMTMAELVGTGDTLEQASITIGMARDHVESFVRNTGALIMFMRETGWPGGEKWALTVMNQESPAPTMHGGVVYTVTTALRGSGVFFVTAAPRSSTRASEGQPQSDDVSKLYTITKDDDIPGLNRRIEIVLFKGQKQATIEAICQRIHKSDAHQHETTFLFFDVRGEPKPKGYAHWAIARFEPDLFVQIFGDE